MVKIQIVYEHSTLIAPLNNWDQKDPKQQLKKKKKKKIFNDGNITGIKFPKYQSNSKLAHRTIEALKILNENIRSSNTKILYLTRNSN